MDGCIFVQFYSVWLICVHVSDFQLVGGRLSRHNRYRGWDGVTGFEEGRVRDVTQNQTFPCVSKVVRNPTQSAVSILT